MQPGTYGSEANPILQTLDPPFGGVMIHGVIGQPRPVLVSSADQAIFLNSGETLRWLEIRDLAAGAQALVLDGGFASGEQVIASASGAGGVGCEVYSLLRNSVCWASGPQGYALESYLSGGLQADPQLRNVTAVATGQAVSGLRTQTVGTGTQLTVHATNVIAMGTSSDISARGAGAAVELNASNFGIRDVAGNASVTAPGSGTNQLAIPVFDNAGNGDFRECLNSPTLGAGVNAISNGPEDVDGSPRVVDGQTDIGAFQGGIDCTPPVPPVPPGPTPTPPPDNQFQIGKLSRRPNGTATLFVRLPDPGSIELRDSRTVTRALARAGAARPARVLRVATRTYTGGSVALRVVPTGIGRRSLRRNGRLGLPVTVTYQPAGGNPNPQRKPIVLLAKRRR